jgi:hypothetical protein
MASELTRLTHKIAILLHLVAESYKICSSHFRRPVRKLLREFENRILVRTFEPMGEEGRGIWRKLYNEEFPNLYFSPHIIREIPRVVTGE